MPLGRRRRLARLRRANAKAQLGLTIETDRETDGRHIAEVCGPLGSTHCYGKTQGEAIRAAVKAYNDERRP